LIKKSVANLEHLSSNTAEYTQLKLMVGSASSSAGDLEQSETLFSEVIENTSSADEKALAHFNRFQVRLRSKAYDTALDDLQAAIALNPEEYALHDAKTYPMLKLLGAGGMGCVFLCQNNNPLIAHKKVVVKCFWETLKGAPEKVFSEAVAMRKIAGNYVPEPLQAAYANVHKQKRAYFVTEYLEGTIDGETWLEKYGKMDLKTGWKVALNLAQGLQVAHDKGIFHLDLKPANILLTDSSAAVPLKIIDFGLAQIAPTLQQEALTRQNQSGLTQFGQAVMGTLHYAPPEQQGFVQYGKPSAKSDVFAFGATMYRLWTGLSPRRFSERNLPNVSALRELIFDCVEENPNQRPFSAGEVLERFQNIARNNKTTKKTTLNPIEIGKTTVTTPIDEVEETKLWIDNKAWAKACEQNTQVAYKWYLNGNTLKKYVNEAKQRIDVMKDNEAWKKACQNGTEVAFQEYLEGKTLKKHLQEIKPQLEAIKADEKAWQKTQEQNNQAAYQTYLDGNTLGKYAQKAEKQLRQFLLSLSVFNPLDHLRLLWWIFVMPQQLKEHKEIFGDEQQAHVGKWLVNTLVLLPLFMLILGLGLELLPHSGNWSTYTFLLSFLVIFWLLTGWLGDLKNSLMSVMIIIAFIVTINIVFAVTFSIAGGLVFLVAFIVTFIVTFIVFIVTESITEKYFSDMGDEGAIGLISGMAIVITLIVVDDGVMFDIAAYEISVPELAIMVGFYGSFLSILFSFAAFSVALNVADVVKNTLKTGIPLSIIRLIFFIFVIDYIFLIYYCFFGGWQLFV